MRLCFLLFPALLAALTSTVFAGPLKDAKVNHALGDVRIADQANAAHAASPQEMLKPGSTVLTGLRSRAELLFPDRTLTRLGSETTLRFKPGSRDLLLDGGTLLLQVPKFRAGARVRAGGLTAAIGGATFLIEHLPGKSLKIVVLEGDLRLSVDGFLGDSIVLTPGKLLITNPGVRRIPDPVDVDLRTLAKTSSLINPAAFQGGSAAAVQPLPSMQGIERKIAGQEKLVARKTLFPTNLVILGSGTNIVIPGASAAQTAVASASPSPETDGNNESEFRNSTHLALERKSAAARGDEVPLPEP